MHAKREGMDMLEIALQCNRKKWLHAKLTHVCLVSKLNYRPNGNIQFAPVPQDKAEITNLVKELICYYQDIHS